MFKRIVLVGLIALALVGLCWAVLRTKKPEAAQSVRLANGTEITFISATFGTNASVVLGKSFQRSLYNLLPAKLKPWSGATVIYSSTSNPTTNDPTFWLLEKSSRRLAGAGGYLPVRVLDEFGCEYDPNGWSMGTMPFGNNEVLSHYQITAGDPHGKIIGICIYDSDARTNGLATFTIPGCTNVNLPVQGIAPSIQRDGDLEAQVLSLVTGLQSQPYAYSGKTNGVPFSRATFHVTKNGLPALQWLPRGARVTDAHGKRVAVRATTPAFAGSNQVLSLEGILDPTNGPFKLRVEFTHYTGFSPEEVVLFKDVPFPTISEPIALEMEAESQGRKLILKNIYPANSQKPVNYFQPGQTAIQVQLLPGTNADHVQLLDALDESGKRMSTGSGGGDAGQGEFYFSFQPSVKAKSMTLTFAVHQSRFVEFEAMPVSAATNEVNKK